MIGCEDDKSILRKPPRRERLFEAPQSLVDIGDLSVVAAVRVRLVRIVQMDEREERRATPRRNPVAGRSENGLAKPLDFGRLLPGIRP